MAEPEDKEDNYGKVEEAIAKSLPDSAMPSPSISTTASSSFYDDDSYRENEYDNNEEEEDSRSDSNESESSTLSQQQQRNKQDRKKDTKPKSSRSEKSKSSSRSEQKQLLKKQQQKQKQKQQQPIDYFNTSSSSNVQLTPAAANFSVLAPPDPSSSSHKRIHLLVCTANLGNAPPDADSWNAWIPKDGKLVTKTQFPVRMNPPPPPPVPPPQPQRSNSGELTGSQPKLRKPVRRSSTGDSSDNKTIFRKRRKSINNDLEAAALEPEKDGYEAYLESLKGGTYSFDDDHIDGFSGSREDDALEAPPTPTSEWRREKGSRKAGQKQQQPGDRKSAPPRRSRSNKQESTSKSDEPSAVSEKNRAPPRRMRSNKQESASDEAVLPARDTPKREKPQKGESEREPRRGVRRSRSNNLFPQQQQQDGPPSTPTKPKSRRIRSKSIDPSTIEQKLKQQQPLKSPTSEQHRRVLRSKSIDERQPLSTPKMLTKPPEQRRRVLRSKSIDERQLMSTPKTLTKTPEQRRRVLRSKSIDERQFLSTPKTLTKTPEHFRRVLSINVIDEEQLLTSPPKTPSTKTMPEQRRRVLRSKSSMIAETKPESSAVSPRPRNLLRNNNNDNALPQDIAARAEESPKSRRSVIRSKSPLRSSLSRTRSKSPRRAATVLSRSKSPKNKDSSDVVPPCRKIVEAEIPIAEIGQIKEFEIRYPNRVGVAADPDNSSSSSNNSNQLGYYDIIVIGMQEATFDLNKKPKKDESSKQQEPKQKKAQIKPEPSNADDDTDSDDESANGETTDDGSVLSLADDAGDTTNLDRTSKGDDDEADSIEETKSAKMKKLMSRRKQGGKPLKAGLLKKITKKASKTAKTVNTFAGGGKDHTARLLQAKPSEDEEDTNIAGLAPSETFISVGSEDTEDEDFLAADADTDNGVPLANGNNGKTNAIKWTDTDFLHHGIESNQLPGYTRALSYQFGQMRLMVYYKAGTAAEDVLQTLDVLSVSYQATGKAGLANKGGIVAEVAVNKTTKLSFLTAHLEAHEGAKHYKARNDSLSSILMDTSSSKYFDASQSSHFTFAMGDLNYRTKLADVAVGSDRHIQFCHTIVGRRDWRTLNQYDELRKSLAKKTCLAGFQTAYCNFPPTFKVDRQHGYRYNPARSPSYTDRILFKTADQLDSGTKLLLYEPVEAFTSSDHKPIRSGFAIRLNRELRWKSTAELLLTQEEFNNKNKSLDDLGRIILPDTTTGDIHNERETMHIFVTNIECLVNPNNYDYLRRQDKAELPNPKVLFITDPSEAVLPLEDSAKKRRFGLGSRSFRDNTSSSHGPSDNPKKNSSSSTKFPSTPISKDTMRPIWKDGYVYFALQTHTEHGRPIDFTGSQLHISLVDTKNSNSVIGSHCLNLAHLVIRSREKAGKTMDRTSSHHGMESAKSQQQKLRSGSKRPGSSRKINEKPGSSRKINENSGSSKRLGGNSNTEKVGKPLKPSRSSSPGSGGYQLVPKPSPAMRSAAANAIKFGSTSGGDNSNNNSNLPQAVKKVAESLHRIENGSSQLYDSIMADLDLGGGIGSSSNNKNFKSLFSSEELGLKSLRLQETLTEGGLVTGHIKCDIDIWWT